MFGFTCQNYVLGAYKELEDRSLRRMTKVTTRHIQSCSALYIFIAVFGYITFVNADPEKNLLIQYNPSQRLPVLIVSLA
jgi:amino acid permease